MIPVTLPEKIRDFPNRSWDCKTSELQTPFVLKPRFIFKNQCNSVICVTLLGVVMKTSVNAILIALLLCLSTIPMTVSAQGDSIQNEVAYGIEYDWSNLDEDIDSLTGINLNEILSRTMLAATDAGLTLTVAQLSTGSSNIYVESAEDRTATTIEIGGESHSVWTRATDVTIRHAVLFDSALVTEWIDSSGADPTGFDGYLSVDSENAVAVDVNMVEYFDDDYNLYGIDMDFSLASEVSVEYSNGCRPRRCW